MRASHLPPNESLSTILFVVLFDFSISNLKQANTRERSGDLALFGRSEWPILRVLRPQLCKVPRPMELALPRLCEICKSEAPSQPLLYQNLPFQDPRVICRKSEKYHTRGQASVLPQDGENNVNTNLAGCKTICLCKSLVYNHLLSTFPSSMRKEPSWVRHPSQPILLRLLPSTSLGPQLIIYFTPKTHG